MYWSARPFVRIFVFLAAGIFTAFKIDLLRTIPLYAYYAVIMVLLIVAILLLPTKLSIITHRVKGIILGTAIFLTGVLLTLLNLPSPQPAFLKGTFAGTVIEQPSESDKTFKTVVLINTRFDSLPTPLHQKVLIYFEKNKQVTINYGDQILFSATLKPPGAPGNPHQFNYSQFLKAKGIEQVAYVPAHNYRITGNNPPNIVSGFAIKIRQKILKALKDNGLSGNEYAIAAAIVLGYNEIMDDQIQQNYQRAGAMHVLCVSGLHVGVIYLVMVTLIGFLNKNRTQKILKTILLLTTVWMYALLTGLAPSVMRATVMISFIIVGNEIERDKDAYNTLAMSAVFLLVYNPGFLFNVGFQLSYAAVLGIVTFYRPLYKLLYIKNRIINKLWAATVVSLSAQAGAFPIAAHYFHFFPTWFLLSNFVILLFSTIIISTGMLFILFSWVPVISGWIAFVLSGMIYLMNYLITIISHLPAAGISDMYFPWIKVIIVYLILITTFKLIIQKESVFIIPLLSSILLLIMFQTYHRFEVLSQNKLIIYDTGSHHPAIDFISGNDHWLLCNTTLLKEPKKIDFFSENSRIVFGLKKNPLPLDTLLNSTESFLWSNGNIFVFNNRVIIKTNKNFYPLKTPLPADVLWITGKEKTTVENLLKTFDVKQVVIDRSIYRKKAGKLKEQFLSLNIPVHTIEKDGAFIH